MMHFISAGSKPVILPFYDLLLQRAALPYFMPNYTRDLVFVFLSGKKVVK